MKEKVFTLCTSSNNVITSSTSLQLIKRQDSVWVMNHIFINPATHNEHELSLLFTKVLAFIRQSNYPVWPLDPIAIHYLKKHPEYHSLWYHAPYSK